MNVRFAAAAPDRAHVLALPIAAGAPGSDRLAVLGEGAGYAARAAAAARFEGEAGGIADLAVPQGDAVRRVLLAGLGAAEDDAAYDRAGGAIAAKLLTSGETVVAIDLTGHRTTPARAARIAYAALVRSWRYDRWKTKLKPAQKPSLREIVVVGAPDGSEAAFARLQALADGVFLTRELVTEPANIIYPESFVARVRGPLEAAGVEVTVLGEAEMAALGMGSLLCVSRGSRREGQLLVMRWKGSDADPVAFVGKGVTFDTGGISIKPAAGMEDMKWDMGGAGAVAGAMLAIARRKAKAHVIGVCGLVENMPDGDATRPGDVVTSMSGQTIEVINTDAEGRLVLCDAITWVQRTHGVKTVVDLATLTGAMIVSLGHEYGGIFANDDDLADGLVAAGKAVGDKLWRFPLADAYDKLIESPIADMKNVGPRPAGSITAAQFLQRFVEEGTRWAHLDIAGMVWAAKPASLWDKGATSYGVALLDKWVEATLEV